MLTLHASFPSYYDILCGLCRVTNPNLRCFVFVWTNPTVGLFSTVYKAKNHNKENKIYKRIHHRTTTKHKKYHEVVNAQEELPANAKT